MTKSISIAFLAILLVGCTQPAATTVPVAPEPAAAPVEVASPPVADDRATINASIDSLLGDHDKYEAVIDAYQKAVTDGDQAAVAALVDYPFETTIGGERVVIGDRAGFLTHYEGIITPAIAGVVKAQKYSELMVNGKGVMFGRGETWINGVCKPGSADCSEFEARVVAIQPGPTD